MLRLYVSELGPRTHVLCEIVALWKENFNVCDYGLIVCASHLNKIFFLILNVF